MFKDLRIVVGCPIRLREWMIEPWFEAVLCSLAVVESDFCFAFAIEDDDPSGLLIEEFCKKNKLNSYATIVEPYTGSIREHNWDHARVEYMVYLRNELLKLVRSMEPDYFLSLDSDILVHPKTLVNLLIAADRFDAVGGKAYLHKLSKIPSYAIMNKRTNNMLRQDHSQLLAVDVIMAIKLMGRKAYNVDYVFDRRGEDIGWSRSAKEKGLTLGYDGRLASKHIMERSMLDSVDKRVGY